MYKDEVYIFRETCTFLWTLQNDYAVQAFPNLFHYSAGDLGNAAWRDLACSLVYFIQTMYSHKI
jgi:hypothetical protein